MFLFSIHFISDFVKRMFSVPIKSKVTNGRPYEFIFYLPPLRHFVTPLLKERLFGSHREELSVMPTVVWLCYFYFRHYSVTSRHLSSRRGSLAPHRGELSTQLTEGGFYRRSCVPSHANRATNGRPQGLFIFTAHQKGH